MNDKTGEQSDETEPEKTWARDQQKRSYYYDDAHGYEIYNPDEDDDEDEEITAADEHR